MKRIWQVENIMQRHWVVIRHWSDVDWRRYRQEYINECSNYLSDPPRSNHPVSMLTNGRSYVIFVIDVDVVARCWSVSFCFPSSGDAGGVVAGWRLWARLLCWSAPGGVVREGLNTCRWWFVSVLGGGGGADCWSGCGLEGDGARNWHVESTGWRDASRWRIGWRMTGVLRDHLHL